jgi:YARHG domain/WG containing repeat
MKTKPILIIAAIVIFAVSTFFLLHKKKSPPNSVELTQFLYKFNNAVNEGNADTVNACFQFSRKNKTLKNLANLLIGKKKKDGSLPLATVILDIDKAETKNIGAGLVSVKIPVSFSHQSLEDNHSVLILKIYKTAHYKLKIIQADTRKFFDDYVNYETYVKNSIHIDDVVYSDLTLASFKTADQLKTRYDSVLWFEHVDGKTFYYVIKGKLNDEFYQSKRYSPAYKMGLVNTDQKEIIPPEYDLIHNVGGTIDGLIEVEMNGKKGLYNLDGKNVVVVIYDQIIPLEDEANLALLRKDDNYFYLKKDTTVTDKIDGFKIADAFPKFKSYSDSYSLSEKSSKNVMEYNEHGNVMSIIVPPSYLVDLQIFPKFINFNNPLRTKGHTGYEEEEERGSERMDIRYNGIQKDDANWFMSAFYSITDHFWNGRSGLYVKNETKPVIIIDKKQNKILSFTGNGDIDDGEDEEGVSNETAFCKENAVRAINDTLFEYKSTSALRLSSLNENNTISEGAAYYYLHVVNGQLAALPNRRLFGCTKYVKMDDSYLNACYVIGDKKIDHVTTELLQYMKNEIYASYGYKFKSDKWTTVFQYRFDRYDGAKNVTVDDSLTEIEKYNINWINSKLNSLKQNTLAAE